MYTSLLLVLGSCLTAQNAADDGKRPLVWAADPNGGVPYIFRDKDLKFVGFEVDLKDALARELGREIKFKAYEFDNLLDGVQRKDFDFAMNGLEIIPRNEKKARFTRPYYVYQLQLVVRQGDMRFTNLQEARNLKLTIGSLGGSVADHVVDEEEVQKKSYEDQDSAFNDLKIKRTDGVLMDLPICLYYAASRPLAPNGTEPSANFRKYAKKIAGLEFAGPPFARGLYGIAVHKDNKVLADQLNQALETLLKKGEIKSILEKWDLWDEEQPSLFKKAEEKSDSTDDQKKATPPFSKFFPSLLEGALETVTITYQSMLLAVMLALPICLGRMYGPAPVRWLATAYVEFFRGIPVLFILYFLYFGLPLMWPNLQDYLNFKAAYVAIFAFGLNYAAYEAEVYRAAIGAVPTGQWEAAASLGMTSAQTFWRIILPQSVRGILPAMTNDLVSLFKDTSLVAAISIADLNFNYRNLSRDFDGYPPIVLTTAALYLLMSVPLGYLSRYLEKRWGVK